MSGSEQRLLQLPEAFAQLAPLRAALVDALAADPDSAAATWLVGGTVRDALLDRTILDVDLVTAANAEQLARQLARAVGGTPFPLGDDHGCWRIACSDASTDQRLEGVLQIDICELRGGTLASDLAARDFTINALAVPLIGTDEIIDHATGMSDLDAGAIRMVSAQSLDDDPLRLLRAARFAHTLGFAIEPATRSAIIERAARITEPAGERVFVELRVLLLNGEARRGWRTVADLDLERFLLPELDDCRGVVQSRFHHLDVYEHTLAVLDNAEDVLAATEFWLAVDQVSADDEQFPSFEWSEQQRVIVLLAAICHDLAKPATRTVLDDGRVGFGGHDRVGMEVVDAIAERWKLSGAIRHAVRKLVGTHLDLGYLLHGPAGDREIWRWLRSVEPVAAEAIVLSISDRMATSGVADRRRWLRGHLELARRTWVAHRRELRDGAPVPLLDGTQLAAVIDAPPGPQIGVLVQALAEEQAVGAITTVDAARAFVQGYDLSESTTRSPSGST